MKKLLNNFVCEIKLKIAKKNYEKKLSELRKVYGKRKIRVLFYVSENQKWGYQSLYEKFSEDENFEPLVVVGVITGVHKGKDKTRMNLEDNYNFFLSKGMNVEYAYKNNNYIDFREFKPDIVFYEQPWSLPKIYKPFAVSKYALTCYCPYGLSLFDFSHDYTSFHKILYKCFTDSDLNITRYEKYVKGASNNCVSIGYPKLDEYLDIKQIELEKLWKDPEKIKIIYAPHHSFEEKGLRMATFKENGRFILELAKRFPQTTWVFKPHPRLKYALLCNKIMTQSEIENYYQEWEKIGKIYEFGSYFDIFKTSDLMITDCCSFLAEYLPSGKPLIRPIRQDSLKLNCLGKKVVEGYYETQTNPVIEKRFYQLVIEKRDEQFNSRVELKNLLIDFKEKSSDKIFQILHKSLI